MFEFCYIVLQLSEFLVRRTPTLRQLRSEFQLEDKKILLKSHGSWWIGVSTLKAWRGDKMLCVLVGIDICELVGTCGTSKHRTVNKKRGSRM